APMWLKQAKLSEPQDPGGRCHAEGRGFEPLHPLSSIQEVAAKWHLIVVRRWCGEQSFAFARVGSDFRLPLGAAGEGHEQHKRTATPTTWASGARPGRLVFDDRVFPNRPGMTSASRNARGVTRSDGRAL